jgi:tetratricopeptide (TPR) repeat protein
MSYSVAHIDEIEELTDGREPWQPIRHHLGISAFGVNAWTGRAAGDRILNEHGEEEEDGQEELYYVLRGRASFELDGERHDAPAGTFVFVRPGTKRTAFAEEAETTLLAVGGTVGKPYEVSGWELWAPVGPLYQTGEYAQAADRMRDVVDANPQYPMLAYNLACVESLAGRREDALEHLRRAVEGSERMRTFARDDSDLDAIRDEPGFKELVG